MKIVNAMVGSLLLAALPLAAQAEDMSYSYIDLNYTDANLDGGPSGDGFNLRGSVSFAENFFAFADYSTLDFPAGIDVDLYSLGLGGRLNISEKLDLVGRVGYAKAEADAGGGLSADDSGYLVSAGLRGQVVEDFELEGHAIYTDFGNGADDTALALGARYFFTPQFAVGAEYQVSDDLDTLFAGVRLSF